MALSIHSQPQTIIDALAREYEIVDEDDVLAFLERYPELLPLLPKIRAAIRQYFGEDAVKLELFEDPEWDEASAKLIINIQTHLASREAIDRIHQFDRGWWLERRAATVAPILVSFEHVRRV